LLFGCSPAEPISSSDLQAHYTNIIIYFHQLFFAPLPPKVWQAKKVYLIGSKLVENKEFLTHLHQKLAIVH